MSIQLLISWFTSFFSGFFTLDCVIYAVMAMFTVALFNMCLRWVRGGSIL